MHNKTVSNNLVKITLKVKKKNYSNYKIHEILKCTLKKTNTFKS